MWIGSKNGHRKAKLIRKDFGDDLPSAEELYRKVLFAGRKAPTLACVNMGFPPPKELRPYTVTKRGRDRRTRKIRTVTVDVQPLKQLNAEGKLWCPYCRKIRPFQLKKTATVHGVHVRDTRYVCPICGISQRDHNVRFWNPTAALHMESSLSRTRAPKQTKTRRRRSRA